MAPRNHRLFILLLILLIPACSATPTRQAGTPTSLPATATLPLPSTTAPAATVPPAPVPAATATASSQPASLPWWSDSVFYEIFVRSFYDSNGDGIGDFNGLISKLDYLNDGDPNTTSDLGITGIYLMPIFPSPSYHGYDTTDYYTVNPDFGTLDDFKRLLAEAHRRGIRVIIDLMLNHTSNQHPWFLAAQDKSSPYHDWYVWSDTDPGKPGPIGGKAWFPGTNGGFYYAVFSPTMPDLNYHNPAVQEEAKKITAFWLQDVKVDGFRLDGTRYLLEEGQVLADAPANIDWFKGWNAYAKSLNPQALNVGEVWTTDFTVASYIKARSFDLAFDFDLSYAFVNAARTATANSASGQLKQSLSFFPGGQFAPILSNHDINRVVSTVGGDEQETRSAAFMLLTAPGVPFLYYGEEIGMAGKKPDERIRAPMPWSGGENAGFSTAAPWEALDESYASANVANQMDDPGSLLSFYRDMVHLRYGQAALLHGDGYVVSSRASQVYALLRSAGSQHVLVLANLGPEPVSEYALTLSQGPLSGSYQLSALLGEGEFTSLAANPRGGFDAYQPLPELPGYARLVLLLQPK